MSLSNDSRLGAPARGNSSESARRPALPLEALVTAARKLECIGRGDVRPGDRLLVSTRNSVYRLVTRADGRFEVSGGIFARESPHDAGARTLAVCGCTAGGRALFTNVVAAPGLFLEFGDGTTTTRIRQVRKITGDVARERDAG